MLDAKIWNPSDPSISTPLPPEPALATLSVVSLELACTPKPWMASVGKGAPPVATEPSKTVIVSAVFPSALTVAPPAM